MTTKPELKLGSHLVPGLAAVALFAVMAAVVLTAPFGDPAGLPADESIVAAIGYAMFDLEGGVPSESFLVAFEIVDLVLVAALVGAVMLARREIEGAPSDQPGMNEGLMADGGRVLRRTLRGEDGDRDAADAEADLETAEADTETGTELPEEGDR